MAASQLHRHHQFALPPCPLPPFHTFPDPASCGFRPTKSWRGLSLCSARESVYSHGSRTESVAVSSSEAPEQQVYQNVTALLLLVITLVLVLYACACPLPRDCHFSCLLLMMTMMMLMMMLMMMMILVLHSHGNHDCI